MQKLFAEVYKNKTVLVTGHTGFKGSWLCLWFTQMGANVIGYSLEPLSRQNHFELLELDMTSIIGDIRDKVKVQEVFTKYQPDIVFHLAAQPLVRYSYSNPVETFETNIMGSINIFEAVRNAPSVKAIVNITSDKAYENKEWMWGYRENDAMGGHDPYSASKGAVELVASSYRNSFFNNDDYGVKHNVLLASCRAGNVIGGGDWAEDRLIPDIMRAVDANEKVEIRSPKSTRPWQHVLEPLSGYLLVGQKLLEGKKEFAEGWNFGPSNEGSIKVQEVVEYIKKYWDKINYVINKDPNQLHEANLLKLDCSKAHIRLNWKDVWDSDKTFEMTVKWYKKFYEDDNILTKNNLEVYIEYAKDKNLEWTK
jgi:CDP-glucose 4,6-dehydratase